MEPSLLSRWMVLVHWNPGASDWHCASGIASDGGSLCIRSTDWALRGGAWMVPAASPRISGVAAVFAVAALAVVTWRQAGYWKTNESLWSHTLDVTGPNLIAEDKLGAALQALGRQDEAMIHFTNAARLNPDDPLSNFSLGADLQWHGRLLEAIPHYEITIRESRDRRLQADAYQNLATDYLQLGDRLRAREAFLAANRANPGLVTVFAGFGELAGEPSRTLSQLVVEHPTAENYAELAHDFQRAEFLPEARLAFEQALMLNPHLNEAEQGLRALRERTAPQ